MNSLLMFLNAFESGFFFTIFSVPFLIFPILFAAVPILVIVIIVKTVKRAHNAENVETKPFKTTISNANNPEDYWNSISSEETENCCEYCGTVTHNAVKKCPSCGAKMNK